MTALDQLLPRLESAWAHTGVTGAYMLPGLTEPEIRRALAGLTVNLLQSERGSASRTGAGTSPQRSAERVAPRPYESQLPRPKFFPVPGG